MASTEEALTGLIEEVSPKAKEQINDLTVTLEETKQNNVSKSLASSPQVSSAPIVTSSPKVSSAPIMTSSPKRTFHMRVLPSPPAIAFASDDGKALFRSSLAEGFMEGYFVLAEQFRTQDEPAFCGLSTMTMVLNALAIDPKRVWKGAWRWYHESMLDCCRDLEEIKKSGIDFDQFSCLGRCNGLEMMSKRPTQRHIYPTKNTVDPVIEEQVHQQNESEEKSDPQNGKDLHHSGCNQGDDCKGTKVQNHNVLKRRYFTLDEFREDIKVSCASSHGPIVIVSYSRKGLQQTGDGHFSPIAGYNSTEDMCLIMDVARFKYPPHWVKTEVLYHAMCRIDPSCDKTRGWVVVSNAESGASYYFTLKVSSIETTDVGTLKEALCCCSSRFIMELLGNETTPSENVLSECDHEHGPLDAIQITRCLLECLPTPLDEYIVSQTEKFGLTLDEKHKVIKSKLMTGIRECGVHQIVCKLFEEESNADLIKRFEKCLQQKEVITLMVLVMGNSNVWVKLSDKKLAFELRELYAIDAEKHPELDHEVKSLQSQIRNLNEFLGSMISPDTESSNKKTFCHH